MWKAAGAAVLLIAATSIEVGCGETYRPIATPLPVTTSNPSGPETEVMLSCCLNPSSSNAQTPTPSSVLTEISVSGDGNMANKVLANVAGLGTAPIPPLPPAPPISFVPMAFDATRANVYTANTTTDSVTQVTLQVTTGGFSSTNTTIALPPGSKPTGMSFQYFGPTYTQDYVINSGTTTATCPGTGSLGVITQATAELKTTVCVGVSPVAAWIYKDQTKVFVLDQTESQIYVVNASSYKVTNKIPLGTGAGPIKVAQSNSDSNYIYVLNSGNGSIAIIDGQAEQVVATVTPSNPAVCGTYCNSPLVDIAQELNYNDTTPDTQTFHVFVLHADGTVSVFDGTTAGQLTWITSVQTITSAQANAGAYPTNLALLRDGTEAYVGVGNTDQIVAINTGTLGGPGAITQGVNGCPTSGSLSCTMLPATTPVTVGMRRTVSATGQTCNPTSATGAGCLEVTTPVVTNIAVSRGGTTSDLSKVYAVTKTSTNYYYYDASGNPTSSRPSGDPTPAWCTDNGNVTICHGLYNGTTVVTAAAIGAVVQGTTVVVPAIPINTYVTTITAPPQLTYCDPDILANGFFDNQKVCPVMTPVAVLGRN
jgi:YVTN family beta-propeller protein